jgi:hypothetical protein
MCGHVEYMEENRNAQTMQRHFNSWILNILTPLSIQLLCPRLSNKPPICVHNKTQEINILKISSPIRHDFQLLTAEQMGGFIEQLLMLLQCYRCKICEVGTATWACLAKQLNTSCISCRAVGCCGSTRIPGSAGWVRGARTSRTTRITRPQGPTGPAWERREFFFCSA